MAAAPLNPNSTPYYPNFPLLPYSSSQPPPPPHFPPPIMLPTPHFYINQTLYHETITFTYCCCPFCSPLTLHYSRVDNTPQLLPSASSVTISEVKEEQAQQDGAPINKTQIISSNNMHGQTRVKDESVMRSERSRHSKFVRKAPARFVDFRRLKTSSLRRFESEMRQGEPGSEINTTVMIKNIPNRFNKKMVLNLLDCHCVNENKKLEIDGGDDQTPSEFDFLYIPIDFRTGSNYGFAFVNFKSAAAAWRLHRELNGKSWVSYGSKKVCELRYARIQGLDALVDHFSASTFFCESDDYLPAYFTPGRDGARTTEEHIVGKRNPPPK